MGSKCEYEESRPHKTWLHVCLELEVGEGGPGPGDPARQVQDHRQVGEGGRQQRPRVEELDSKVEPSVPATLVWNIFFLLHILDKEDA